MNNVWEGLKDYRERGQSIPENDGRLGVIEPEVGRIVARRFKHRCSSWSREGAINLAKMRCFIRNGNLIELLNCKVPQPTEENKELKILELA